MASEETALLGTVIRAAGREDFQRLVLTHFVDELPELVGEKWFYGS